jgi:HEAT repeat protein
MPEPINDELQQQINASVSELLTFLADDDEATRLQVLMALTRIENLSVIAANVPRLFNAVVVLLFDESPEIRTFAAILVGRFDEPRGTDPLMHCVTNANEVPTVRNAALASMLEFSELPEPTVEQLRNVSLELLQTATDDELRATATWVLGRLPGNAAVICALTSAMDDNYEWVQKYAAESLSLLAHQN